AGALGSTGPPHRRATRERVNTRTLLLALLAVTPACDDSDDPPADSLRGDRYCEILLGTADLAAGTIEIAVYNTEGLNDCPADAWAAIDAEALKAELDVDAVILNGPRFWTIDAFDKASLIDPEVRELGGIEMRKTG